MNYKNFFLRIITLVLFTFSFIGYASSAHLKPEEYECKPESKRTILEKMVCKQAYNHHRLCKLDAACAIRDRALLEMKAKEQEEQLTDQEQLLNEAEDKLNATATCGDLIFNHKAKNNSSIFKLPNKKSKEISKIKKNQDLLFISPSSKNKSWYFVKIKMVDGICADGFVDQKFVVKKVSNDVVVKSGPKLIEILNPVWEIEDQLILVDAEGSVSITGVIQDGKIDKIVINDDEEIINDDNTFTFVKFVQQKGAEIRIIGSKNNKKVKELTFKIKVQ